MADAEGIIKTFLPFRKAADPLILPERVKPGVSASQNLMGISLMSHVPDNSVFRGIEEVMKGDRQFNRAETGTQVASRSGNDVDNSFPDFSGQKGQLFDGQTSQV